MITFRVKEEPRSALFELQCDKLVLSSFWRRKQQQTIQLPSSEPEPNTWQVW